MNMRVKKSKLITNSLISTDVILMSSRGRSRLKDKKRNNFNYLGAIVSDDGSKPDVLFSQGMLKSLHL